MADVVLPAVSFAEKHGTITNTERRVQLTSRALVPLPGLRTDHEIIADLAQRFGATFPRTPEALFQEIRDLTPSYRGLTYDRLREVGIQWPCPAEDHPGTRFLHKDKFVRGKAVLTPMQYKPPAEEPTGDWPMRLSTGRMLEHFHTGSMSRRAPVLDAIVKCGLVEVHPRDAAKLGLKNGDRARIVTRRGAIETKISVVGRVAEGSIFVPFHFAEAAANRLTNDALDPVAKIPEYKICAARLERL
jgi:predicted molibdopterin-dependent oxidoreductase YjgC